MESATTRLLQSQYYTPVFNTAIFDGPMRFYFAQQQEDEALKVYFKIQEYLDNLKDGLRKARNERLQNSTLFVMLYPNEESYIRSFDTEEDFESRRLGEDFIVGIKGPNFGETGDGLLKRVDEILKAWS